MVGGAAFGRVEKNELDKLRAEIKQLESEKTDDMATMREKMERMEKALQAIYEGTKPSS